MSSQPNPSSERPTTDQLAGVYLYIEGEEKVTPPPNNGDAVVETPAEFRRPTTDQLAGIYLCIEGEEKVAPANTPPAREQP
jgi:predicted DNA repair protein MutK